ncbi:hypothetical protein GCM10023168_25570 [Fodinibacter luteus]|uniref:Uncharacterized protein n=1 Tax=Fodinibacter luteus TaxID=552064 RepID=A0ABP8KJ52_9MICO
MRRMSVVVSVLAGAALVAAPLVPASGAGVGARPGDASAGDDYVGRLGNGGYDVSHYDLDVRYDPDSDMLWGVATIQATATQNLSRFNLDLQGLTVRSVTVDGSASKWQHLKGELRTTPNAALSQGTSFTTVVEYDGVPATLPDGSGFVHTDDGAVVIGEPEVAATWFPVNDHPSDKASYRFDVTVPDGVTAVANGALLGTDSEDGWRTFTWDASEPMASYLATATMGQFDLRSYEHDGIRLWDAVDLGLYEPVATPRTGSQFLVSQQADSSYKRLTRTITVPSDGATLSFWVTRATEQSWDHFFVEARHAGGADWTTLPDANGHSSTDTGSSCPYWLPIHPFLSHYQTENADGACDGSGTTGAWNAASGSSDGPEQWSLDLGAYAGEQVEVSLTYASDDIFQLPGVFVDDVVVSTGEGSTSFEADGDTLDGWIAADPPEGSPGNDNTWVAGGAADVPPPLGASIDASLARHGDVLDFLSASFGPYPFATSGGIVDDDPGLGFALENQTRPIYSKDFFGAPEGNVGVVVHELAHQWYGDSLAVQEWKHIWLNEGFATYAEWLWEEHEGAATAQELFDFFYGEIPPDDPFWDVVIGDPGRDLLFDFAVYARGAMTLHQLRLAIGDEDFFTVLQTWADAHKDGNVTTAEFVNLAEAISGQQLDALFDTWLFTPGKPALTTQADAGARSADASVATPPRGAQHLLLKWKESRAAR